MSGSRLVIALGSRLCMFCKVMVLRRPAVGMNRNGFSLLFCAWFPDGVNTTAACASAEPMANAVAMAR